MFKSGKTQNDVSTKLRIYQIRRKGYLSNLNIYFESINKDKVSKTQSLAVTLLIVPKNYFSNIISTLVRMECLL